MRVLSASELLDIWDRGLKAPPVERAQLLLSGANPDRTPAELSRLCIGKRDALLLEMLEKYFAINIPARSVCPGCGMDLELNLCLQDLKAQSSIDAELSGILNVHGYEAEFRLPDSLDLYATSQCSDLESARKMLIDRCVSKVRKYGEPCNVADLPLLIQEAISSRMGELDPQANIGINLTCPSCQQKWTSSFDVVLFLWSHVDAWARRTLWEVHLLAASYGWSEADILAMSQLRRQAYMEMIQS